MIIAQTFNKFVIRLPYTANAERMQDMMDCLRHKEMTAEYSIAQLFCYLCS
jgi:hypothetical protein